MEEEKVCKIHYEEIITLLLRCEMPKKSVDAAVLVEHICIGTENMLHHNSAVIFFLKLINKNIIATKCVDLLNPTHLLLLRGER